MLTRLKRISGILFEKLMSFCICLNDRVYLFRVRCGIQKRKVSNVKSRSSSKTAKITEAIRRIKNQEDTYSNSMLNKRQSTAFKCHIVHLPSTNDKKQIPLLSIL